MNSYYIGQCHSPHLSHHGIKGQKWGVRRYQNPDGSLTALGRAYYGVGEAREKVGGMLKTAAAKTKEAVTNAAASAKANLRERYLRKHPDKMTDEELKAHIDRMDMEKRYSQIQADLQKNKDSMKKESKIAKFVGDNLEKTGNAILKKATETLVDNMFKKPEKPEKPDETTDWRDVLEHPDLYSDRQVQNAANRFNNIRNMAQGRRAVDRLLGIDNDNNNRTDDRTDNRTTTSDDDDRDDD